MKNTTLGVALLLFALLSCTPDESFETTAIRYQDNVFTQVIKSTVKYDQQKDFNGNAVDLYADLYQAEGDLETSRAAIIFVHGGGFIGGTRDGSNIPYLCTELAKHGYVVASIDYRLGVPDETPKAKGKAQIRAVQDLKSFIRFAKKNAVLVKIDTNRIFITGSSAGGATVLATAFMEYNERPAYLDTSGVGSIAGKGNLNGSSSKAHAVYSMWGALSDTLWLQKGNIPVGCIQSINDPCIPWNYLPSSCNVPGFGSFGSNAIHLRAKHLGIYTVLHGFNSNVHDLGMEFPNVDTTIAKMTSFFFPLAKR